VAIALRSKVPIKIDSNLLETLSIHETQINIEPSDQHKINETKTTLNYDDLNKLMAEALINENYELAAKLRDDISRLKNTNEIK
jgi:protein-arginine kinase activator protein McsA